MANLTISSSTSVTIDGRVVSANCVNSVQVLNVLENTSQVESTYRAVVKGTTGAAAFYVFINSGTTDAIVRFFGSSIYFRWAIPAGGHIVIPGSFNSNVDGRVALTEPYLATASGTTTVYSLIAFYS